MTARPKRDAELLKRIPHANDALKTFAIANREYCAHCGLWYTTGDTAYVEPVATVPEHRKHGLAKTLVYEHVRAPMRLVQSAPSSCLTKHFIPESVSHFLRKCMIGSTLILIDFAGKASKNPPAAKRGWGVVVLELFIILFADGTGEPGNSITRSNCHPHRLGA